MSETATFSSGGVPTPPFAFLPDPVQVFTIRAERFHALATGHLAPYLTFLGDLAAVQADLARELGPAPAPDAAMVARARDRADRSFERGSKGRAAGCGG